MHEKEWFRNESQTNKNQNRYSIFLIKKAAIFLNTSS